MSAVYWLWLGGVLAHAAATFTNSWSVTVVRRVFYTGDWREKLVFSIITILSSTAWPLALVFNLIPLRVFERALKLANDRAQARCVVCDFPDETIMMGDWFRVPLGWWSRNDGQFVCSRPCAMKLARTERAMSGVEFH